MIHLRLIVPPRVAPRVVEQLLAAPGVAHVVRFQGAGVMPSGDLILCDVVREAADGVVESLQAQGVHRDGAITIEALEAVISDAAERAAVAAPGNEADALIWEELEARARTDADLSVSFLVFMCIAAVIAGIGILLDAPILIVGAMVVGPEYGPLAALCVSAVRRRRRPVVRAVTTVATGLAFAAAASLAATTALRLTGLVPEVYDVSGRELTSFISRPDALAAIVAILAGVVGMLSLTEARSGPLIGVLVSVTTIPAAANVGVATAYGAWSEVAGAALQLAVNVVGLVVAGVVTLGVQARLTSAFRRPLRTSTPWRGRPRPG
ncbi:MAG TPA: DUF389 domain-containing protein [Acidimicrobiales bacterium]|nr:DUF389 domain-containing protein [Acidimicrobiales bacterium]